MKHAAVNKFFYGRAGLRDVLDSSGVKAILRNVFH
jgi:hypothetical protein